MIRKRLPEKTIERLSEYRRTLLDLLSKGKTHIYSHELALLHHITAVQVRRDIMFLGYTSPGRKGYSIKDLIKVIGRKIDSKVTLKVAIVGMGNYGKAITAYLKGKRPTMEIVVAFDLDPKKIGVQFGGVPCYSIDEATTVIREKEVSIAILTVPPSVAEEVMQRLIEAGIKGFLNFTSVLLKVPNGVYLEEYDMITSLEKVAYYVKEHSK